MRFETYQNECLIGIRPLNNRRRRHDGANGPAPPGAAAGAGVGNRAGTDGGNGVGGAAAGANVVDEEGDTNMDDPEQARQRSE